MKIAIFLGAGASAAEHCPIQSQLFVEYFKSLTKKDYKSEMNIELHKFFKDMFNIDTINDDIDKICNATANEQISANYISDELKQDVTELKRAGKDTEAIKLLRNATSMSLLEAKEYFDKL